MNGSLKRKRGVGERHESPDWVLAPFEKETSADGRGGGLRTAVFFPWSL